MRWASSSGQIRKSPRNHLGVGEMIRNPALRFIASRISTFPQAILKKEKEPKRKKTAATFFLLSFKLPLTTRTIRGELVTALVGPQPLKHATTYSDHSN